MLPTARPALAWDRADEAVVLAANTAEDPSPTKAGASDAQTSLASAPEPPPVGPQSVVYIPPRRGAPRARVGAGGVRGSAALPRPLALAPDHIGLTVSASPSLFWHIDAALGRDAELIFTLIDDLTTEPLAEITLDDPGGAGIQRLRLSKYGVQLEPEVEYTWSIALVPDAEQRSNDVVSLGFIRRVARPDGFAAETSDAAAFAEAGIWYDALEALSDAVDADPADGNLRSLRSSLLRQAQLDAAVE
jgi:hypothetical protein